MFFDPAQFADFGGLFLNNFVLEYYLGPTGPTFAAMTEHPFASLCNVSSLWLLLELWLPTPSCLLFLPVARLGRTMSAIRAIRRNKAAGSTMSLIPCRARCCTECIAQDWILSSEGPCRLMLAKRDYFNGLRSSAVCGRGMKLRCSRLFDGVEQAGRGTFLEAWGLWNASDP